jgi:phage shock protein C
MVDMKRALYRIPQKGKIAGVCAGLAEYFEVDVTLMRVIWVVVAFATGGGMVVLYILLAIILPVSDGVGSHIDSKKNDDDAIGEKINKLGRDLQNSSALWQVRNYLGIGLVILGSWLLLVQFVPQWIDFRWDYVWPVILIVIGVLTIIRRNNND